MRKFSCSIMHAEVQAQVAIIARSEHCGEVVAYASNRAHAQHICAAANAYELTGGWSHKFFTNQACKHFPCHFDVPPEKFNCMFCFCPLYHINECGGTPRWISTEIGQMKDCTLCNKPHMGEEGYDFVLNRLEQDFRSK